MGWGEELCLREGKSAVKFVVVLLFGWLNGLKQRGRAEKQWLYTIHGDDEALIWTEDSSGLVRRLTNGSFWAVKASSLNFTRNSFGDSFNRVA